MNKILFFLQEETKEKKNQLQRKETPTTCANN